MSKMNKAIKEWAHEQWINTKLVRVATTAALHSASESRGVF
jgi:hypothetical protein